MIKKYLLFLALALPACGQVSTQKVANTAVIYDANSPVTMNAFMTTMSNAFVRGNLTVTNGNLTVVSDLPRIDLIDTNSSGAIRINFLSTGGIGGVIGIAETAGQIMTSSQPGDMILRQDNGGRLLYGIGSGIPAFIYDGNNHTFQGSGVNVVVSNSLTVVGTVTSATNNSLVYRVGGITGFSGVVTNDIGTVTNIMFFGSGILTNLTRIPP